MTPNNIRQSYMPEGAIAVKNPNGTAPCFIVEEPRGIIYSLPGVPVEMTSPGSRAKMCER